MDRIQKNSDGTAEVGDDDADRIGAYADTTSTESLLDEIDGILEVNAEEFVKGYVQKGGQ